MSEEILVWINESQHGLHIGAGKGLDGGISLERQAVLVVVAHQAVHSERRQCAHRGLQPSLEAGRWPVDDEVARTGAP